MAIGLAGLIFTLTACEENMTNDVTLYEPGNLEAAASVRDIKFGETITYTDKSTKVHRRSWVFEGGEPYTSGDPVVTVTYPRGGSFKTVLNLTYIDNLKAQQSFDIEVEKDPGLVIPDYEFGDTYGLYTEMETTSGKLESVAYIDMNQFPGSRIAEALEGVEAYKLEITGGSDWAMGALQGGSGRTADFTPFANGYYNIALKSECQAPFLLRIRSNGGGNAIFEFTAAGAEYGFQRDGRWHLVSIPVADIRTRDPNIRLNEVTDFFLFRSGSGDVRNFENYTFYVDHIFLSEKVELK